jgi:putative transposase
MEEQARQLKSLVADQSLDHQMLRSVMEKKLRPQQRRHAAQRLTRDFSVSERRACRVLAQPRRTHRYIRVLLDTVVLRGRIRTAAYLKPRDGYRRVWHTLRKDMPGLGLRRVYRLFRAEGLTMKRRRPKRARRGERAQLSPATAPDHRWSVDFIHDQLVDCRYFRVLNIIDDFKRETVAVEVDTSPLGVRVTRVLGRLATVRGLPKVLTCDSGGEFKSRAMQGWATRHGVRLNFTTSGKPTQNAFVEPFNGRMEDEFLNQTPFTGCETRSAVPKGGAIITTNIALTAH